MISLDKFQVNPFANTTPYAFKEELEKSKSTFEIKLVFNQPVREIEEYIDRLNSNPKSLCSTIKMDSSRLLPESKGESYPVCGFIFKDTWLNLYRNIRQEAIDNLMKL